MSAYATAILGAASVILGVVFVVLVGLLIIWARQR
jgi:hypothetical protein